jgi:uncharacterized membrane protein YbhN (UPF0104 family)
VTVTGPEPIAPTPAKPTGANRRSVATRLLLLVGIAVVVFVLILPRVVDYKAVGAALSSLSGTQLAVLVAVTLVAYVANAAPARILMPVLGWRRAVGADLAGRAVVSTIPGPTDVATRFVLYRQWGIPGDAATAVILFSAFFETLALFVLPLIATIALLVTGTVTKPAILWLAVISTAVLALSLGLLVAIVRSESLARRFGDWLQRVANRLWPIVRKTPPTGIAKGVLDVRERSTETLSRGGLLAFAAAVVGNLVWFVVLEVALWSVGVTPEVLPPPVVLATMAAVTLVSQIPITPGAVGVAEVGYIGLLTAVAGDGLTAEITAAIVIFRAAQWLAPIPIGWILLVIMRGQHWRELEAEPGDAAATAAPTEIPASS